MKRETDNCADLLSEARVLLAQFAAIAPGHGWDDEIAEAKRIIAEIDEELAA